MKELIFTKEANKIIFEKKSKGHIKDTKNKYHCDHRCDFMGWVSLASQIFSQLYHNFTTWWFVSGKIINPDGSTILFSLL